MIQEKNGWSCITCQQPLHYKFGTLLNKGILVAHRKNPPLSWTRRFSVDAGGCYAHDAVVEVYNSPTYDYCEIEVHAHLIPLKEDEEASHRQEWTFAARDFHPC
ncbi:MAG: hypothetical protein WB791_00260 [Waddliaceae bacterium]